MLRTAIVLLTAGTLTFAAATVPSMFQQMEAPAPEHANLQKMVGEWEGTITMTMPGMPEMKSDAKETVRSNGPFWTTSDFHSEFMGMPYHGHGCHGYSPEMGKFRSTWIDNSQSFLAIMEGEYDEEQNAVISKWDGPNMMGKMVPHRSVQKMAANGQSYTMTFFTEDVQTMVISMKRVGDVKAMEAATK